MSPPETGKITPNKEVFGGIEGYASLGMAGGMDYFQGDLPYVCQDELMLDDSTRFAEKARNRGVDVTLKIGRGRFHCYPALSPFFPEAKEAMNAICAFFYSHIGPSDTLEARDSKRTRETDGAPRGRPVAADLKVG